VRLGLLRLREVKGDFRADVAAVKESKDRVTSAISNSSLRWPYGKRITINLAPADVRKEGPSFDLPIALGMLKLEENNRLPALDAFCISGELPLSGQLRPVKGVARFFVGTKGSMANEKQFGGHDR
jgi:predicted ATPase with chaperone activity